MGYAPPRPSDMFGTDKPSEVADQFETFKSLMSDAHAVPLSPQTVIAKAAGNRVADPKVAEAIAALESNLTVEKGVSADVLASITSQLDALKAVQGDITKDWTSTSPLSTGLVAYDLQAPAKLLVPRATPLRNRTPRSTAGVGTTARYKRITGVSNAGVGGVADVRVGFNSESVSNTFGGVTGLRRPNKISYAADDQAIIFQESGLSDSVTMKAQFQSMGFENLRQLSQTALLWATLLGEEKELLWGRGTASGFKGAIAAPTAVAAVAATAGTGQTGNSANIANLFIYVTAKGGYGESVPSTVLNSTILSATTGKVANVTWTDSTGALGYNVYAGLTTGIANAYLYGSTQTNAFTINFTGAGTGGALNAGTQSDGADHTAAASDYDGFLTAFADPATAGYVNRLNGNFSTSNPGTEFQAAFQSMFAANQADPDVIWMYAAGRVALSDLLKTAASANYRLAITQPESRDAFLGSLVTGVLNEVTGKMVDLIVHPYMPKGCSIIHSESLPIPDSEVSSTVEVRNVVDYLSIEWPQIQMTYDISTYMLGAPIFYAPAWSGVILGIGN